MTGAATHPTRPPFEPPLPPLLAPLSYKWDVWLSSFDRDSQISKVRRPSRGEGLSAIKRGG
jgi:hypothetical protein